MTHRGRVPSTCDSKTGEARHEKRERAGSVHAHTGCDQTLAQVVADCVWRKKSSCMLSSVTKRYLPLGETATFVTPFEL